MEMMKRLKIRPNRILLVTPLMFLSFLLIILLSNSSAGTSNSLLNTQSKFLGIGGTGPAGIGDTSPTGTPTVTPTDIPVPTATPTPLPTETPVPPTPTFTPTPTPVILPQVSITNPLIGSFVKHNSQVSITATAKGDVGVQRVDFYINSVLKCSDSQAAYGCLWNVPAKPRLTYTIEARAFDTTGNSASDYVTVTSQ